jgi:hypothetical protein
MAIQIQFRRGTAAEWSSVNPTLAEGELGIELDTDLFKLGNGVDAWNDLEYGGLRGFTGSFGFTGSIGNQEVDNVLYVAKNGDDANDGRSLAYPKQTIAGAVAIATYGDTIFVKSGDYIENNPINVPEGVAIVGDNLRTTTVRPFNKTQDLFWVNNGVYLTQMTFKDHESPAAAVAFPTDGSAGVIHTSPYVQNCTSMTSTGTGMRVDGSDVEGLKSFVVDAYTQYNQGGIGIHHLNGGNSQLVSVFTICCDIAVLCESGGFCSMTNSNSSFGNYGLKADGVSTVKYTGTLVGETIAGNTFVIENLVNKPSIGDAVKFAGDDNYYTLSTSTALSSGNVAITYQDFSTQSADRRNTRNIILDIKSKIQVDAIDFLNEIYPDFNFNQFKCSRDIGLIIDAVADDMVFGTNYKTILAGKSYYLGTYDSVVFNDQKTEYIAALNFVKTKTLEAISTDSTQTPEYTAISNNFDKVIDIFTNGLAAATSLEFPSPTGISDGRTYAREILLANLQFLVEEGIAYIAEFYPALSYNETKCRRDIEIIINAVIYDILYGGNSQTADAADEYYASGALQVPTGEKQATIDTFAYIKTVAANCLANTTVVAKNVVVSQDTSLTASTGTYIDKSNTLFDIVIDLIDNAYTSTVTIEESTLSTLAAGTTVTFHQFSLITASGHTFEWVGSGTNINTALPYLGAEPIQVNQVIESNQGKIYFTGTDEKGDFRIGGDLTINRNSGTITGRTFSKSLFAVLTPYILAIGG